MSRKIPVDLSLPQKIHLAFNVPLIVNSPELRNCRHFVFYYLFLGLDCSYVSFVPMYCLFLCLVLSYVFPFPMFCTVLCFSLSYPFPFPMFGTVLCFALSHVLSFPLPRPFIIRFVFYFVAHFLIFWPCLKSQVFCPFCLVSLMFCM